MKPARSVALAVAAALLLSLPAFAQDEGPTVTVVPNDQFCNLVADDLAACEQALTTLASAGLLPEAFAGLLATSGPGASGDSSGATSFGNGDHFVGMDIEPGTYRSAGLAPDAFICAFFGYDAAGDTVDGETTTEGSLIMVVDPSWEYVSISGCEPFERVK